MPDSTKPSRREPAPAASEPPPLREARTPTHEPPLLTRREGSATRAKFAAGAVLALRFFPLRLSAQKHRQTGVGISDVPEFGAVGDGVALLTPLHPAPRSTRPPHRWRRTGPFLRGGRR